MDFLESNPRRNKESYTPKIIKTSIVEPYFVAHSTLGPLKLDCPGHRCSRWKVRLEIPVRAPSPSLTPQPSSFHFPSAHSSLLTRDRSSSPMATCRVCIEFQCEKGKFKYSHDVPRSLVTDADPRRPPMPHT